ncbi:MAG: N-acetylmuramoyl-L-alanine amidase [Micrococcales bacterium]|nr:N-acetylmuramoyl-L-alanine amidase [Micrococcales bacterium]
MVKGLLVRSGVAVVTVLALLHLTSMTASDTNPPSAGTAPSQSGSASPAPSNRPPGTTEPTDTTANQPGPGLFSLLMDLGEQLGASVPTCQADGHQTVVFLDPGHGVNLTPTAATSGGSEGIYSGESANGQEDIDVFAVALRAKEGLEQAGYLVVLSRTTNPDQDQSSLWQKGNAAQVANDGQPADIGISLHTDAVSSVGAGQIYYNKQGGFRQNSGDGLRRTFDNPAVAATAQRYAEVFQQVRSQDQGAPITITAGHEFPASRNLGSFGDIPIVMLSAPSVPWVYNEYGRNGGGLTDQQIEIYANSIVRATNQAIGPTEGTGPAVYSCN